MPKMDLKMMVLPIMFILQKQIDMTNPETINSVRMGFLTIGILAVGSYLFIYQIISGKKDMKVMWVPPPPQPALPFGPQPKPPTAADYVKTNYHDHELHLVFEALKGLAISCGMALFLSWKFQIHMSCLMNCVMVPLGLFENVLVKSYILGMKQDRMYKEELVDPNTIPSLQQPVGDVVEEEEEEVEPPRVEELDDDDDDNAAAAAAISEPVEDSPIDKEDDGVKIELSDVHDVD